MTTTTVNININGYESLGELEFQHPQLENLDNLVTKDDVKGIVKEELGENIVTPDTLGAYLTKTEAYEKYLNSEAAHAVFARKEDTPPRINARLSNSDNPFYQVYYDEHLVEEGGVYRVKLGKPDAKGLRKGYAQASLKTTDKLYNVQATVIGGRDGRLGLTSVYVDEVNIHQTPTVGITIVTNTTEVDMVPVAWRTLGYGEGNYYHEAEVEGDD